MKETKDELVKRLLDVKAEQSNLIDLDAYALGLEAMYEAINYTRCCKSDSELLKIPKTTKEQRVQLNEGYNKK